VIQLYIRGEVVTVRNGEASCPTNHDVEREVRALGGIATAESPVDHAERLARELGGKVLSVGEAEQKASRLPEPPAPAEPTIKDEGPKSKPRK